MTHLAAGVLAGGRAAFPPLMGASEAGAGALDTGPARPCLAPLLEEEGPFTPAGWVMDCLAAILFSASSRACHHFCSDQTGGLMC